MVDVELTSADCNMAINWYIHKYGKSQKKAALPEIKFLSKLETMRDALLVEEENFKDLLK